MALPFLTPVPYRSQTNRSKEKRSLKGLERQADETHDMKAGGNPACFFFASIMRYTILRAIRPSSVFSRTTHT